MKSIKSLVGTLTIIAVSHRYSTLADCKKIFEIKNSSISEVKVSEFKKNFNVTHEN